MKYCSIDGCNEEYRSKGFCIKHYNRYLVYRDPLYTKTNMDYSDICNIEECSNKYHSKGLCSSHYYKQRYIENPERKLKANKKWAGLNPEKVFISSIKTLEKCGKYFEMTGNQFRYSFKIWSNIIKNRDKYCQICNCTENLQAHHILFKQYYPKLALNINNGITLCVPCHEELHGFSTY